MNKLFLLVGLLLLSVFDLRAKTPIRPAPSIVADFTADTTVICEGGTVNFTDLTTENPIRWNWDFEGGSPASSSAQHPTITYNTAGTYSVILEAHNADDSDIEIKVEFIKVIPNPSSTFSPSPNQCLPSNSFSFTNTGSTGTHFWTFGDGSPGISSLANPSGITFGAGSHFVTHTVTDDGCSSTTTAFVSVFNSPTALAVTTTASNCAGANGTLSIGATTGGTGPFTYSVNNTNFTSSTSFPGRPPGTYTITVKDVNGCLFTRTAVVGISGGPTAVATQITSSTCGNANGIINIGTVTGGVGPYLFAIDNGALSTTTTYSTIAAGNHVVKVRDVNGCQFSKQVIVTNTFPSAVAITTTPSTCAGSTGTISLGAVTGGRSPYTFSVDGNAFSTATLYGGKAPGTHTIVVKDVTGCTLTTTTTVTTVPGPFMMGSSSTFSTCSSPTGSVSVQPFGGTNPFTFSLNGGAFLPGSTFTGLAAGVYTVVAKDANGCTISQGVSVFNTPAATAIAITTSPSACAASTGTITLGTVTGGTAPYTFSVNGSAFTATTSYSGLSGGTHSVVVKDANGCTFTTSATISSTAPTAAVITTTPSSCGSTGTITIGAITGGVSPFVYSVNGSAFTSATTYTGKPAGTYTVSVKDFNGCVFTQTVTITSSQPTALAVTATGTPCGANTGTVTIGAVTGGVSPLTYSVNNSAFTTTTNYTGLAAEFYTVTVKDANGCTFTTSATVTSNSGPTAFVVTNTGATCTGNNGTITAGAVTGGTPPFTYSLDNGTFTGTTTYIGVSPGTHSVRVKDAGGCVFTTVTTITNTPGPTNVVLTLTHAACGNSTGTIDIGAVTGGTPPFTYSLDGGAFTSATTYPGLAPGLHQVMVKDANNCTLFNSRTINALPSGPTAVSFDFRNNGCLSNVTNSGFVVVTGVTGGVAPFTYSFNGSAFTTITGYSLLAAGTYTLIAKDANGCTVSETITLTNGAPGPSAFTFSDVDPSCGQSNGSITITGVTGGTAPYEYSLGGTTSSSNTFTGLPAGLYGLTISDVNGCASGFSPTMVLATPGGPSGINTSFTSPTCQQANGTITVNSVTGGVAPFQYSLHGSAFQSSTTFTGVQSGVAMLLVVRDLNGCTFQKTIVLNNNGAAVSTPVISQSGFLLTSSGSTGNQWFFNGVAISGSTAQTHFAQFNGSYTVVRTVGICSSAASAPVIITNQSARFGAPVDTSQITEASEVRNNDSGETPLVIAASAGASALIAYPNPNDGAFTIAFHATAQTTYTVEVFNVFGQLVFAEQVSGVEGTYTKQLQLDEFGAGVYTVVLTSPDEKTVQKVVTY